MAFDTQITLTGPWCGPIQMLEEQSNEGRKSVRDGDTAASLGLTGAPIEGPTYFTQFEPLAVELWGHACGSAACISSHFRTMVVEGEEVQASATTTGDVSATIEAHKRDGTPALEGTISLGPDHPQVGLAARTKRYRRSPWRGRSGAAPSRSGSPAFFRSNRDRAPRFAGALLTSRVTVAYRRLLDVIGARSCAVPDDLSRMLVVSRGTASSAETCRSSSR